MRNNEFIKPVEIQTKIKEHPLVFITILVVITVLMILTGIDRLDSFKGKIEYSNANVDTEVTVYANISRVFYPIVPISSAVGDTGYYVVVITKDDCCLLTCFSNKQWKEYGFEEQFKNKDVGEYIDGSFYLEGYTMTTASMYYERIKAFLVNYASSDQERYHYCEDYILQVGDNAYQEQAVIICAFAVFMVCVDLYLIYRLLVKKKTKR